MRGAPRYEHDCTYCQFVGMHGDDDLYACNMGSYNYLYAVARWGNSRSQSVSVPLENPQLQHIEHHPGLIDAIRYAYPKLADELVRKLNPKQVVRLGDALDRLA